VSEELAAPAPAASREPLRAIISDFGGVLTSPLVTAFAGWAQDTGIPLEHLGGAMATLAERSGEHPLLQLETGALSEADFLAGLEREITTRIGQAVSLAGFAERYFAHLHPNERLFGYLRELRTRGLKLAICTNNVREWEPLWRAKLPEVELFDVIVDSGFVGLRKPDPAIYHLTLERLGVQAEEALLIDDVEHNCHAAREVGLRAVWFRDTEQAIAEVERELGAGGTAAAPA
jgi:putative hydrolase of the HAD superfamily